MDYKFGTKNNWRRWQWNRIAERVQDRRLPILYLTTAEDYDRPIALSLGFRNLIGVNRDESVCKTLRAEGHSAICGDLSIVIAEWPGDLQLGGVVADLCCGFNHNAANIFRGLTLCRAIDGWVVLALNLMRGRDPQSNEVRSALARAETKIPAPRNDDEVRQYNEVQEMIHNRAWQAVHWWVCIYGMDKNWSQERITKTVVGNFVAMQEVVRSYRSSAGVFMDSMVLKWHWGLCPCSCPELLDENGVTRNEILDEISALNTQNGLYRSNLDWKEETQNCRRRLVAMKAMKTMAQRDGRITPANQI